MHVVTKAIHYGGPWDVSDIPPEQVEKVLLNGEELKDCVEADDEKGYAKVLRYRYKGELLDPDDGPMISGPDDEEPPTGYRRVDEWGEAQLWGDVKIITREETPCQTTHAGG